jgi:hypothetical protein
MDNMRSVWDGVTDTPPGEAGPGPSYPLTQSNRSVSNRCVKAAQRIDTTVIAGVYLRVGVRSPRSNRKDTTADSRAMTSGHPQKMRAATS